MGRMTMPWLLAALIVGLGTAVPVLVDSPASATAQEPAIVTDAKQVITMISEGKFTQVTERWNAKMKEALPAPKVEQFWKELVSSVGAFKSVAGGPILVQGQFQTAVLTVSFERGDMIA